MVSMQPIILTLDLDTKAVGKEHLGLDWFSYGMYPTAIVYTERLQQHHLNPS